MKAVIVATSDKVYENREDQKPFAEGDRLGGLEPYGVSKAAGEFIVQAFKHSLPKETGLAVATVRAGNVIGGGDWAEDRLVPDAVLAFQEGRALKVRNPNSTRPWQHVFDPLAGYLLLAEHLNGGDDTWQTAWNFGPNADAPVTPVCDVAEQLTAAWNGGGGTPEAHWLDASELGAPYEAKFLAVDSSKATQTLGWQPRIPLAKALDITMAWYLAQQQGQDMTQHARDSLNSVYPLG